LCLAEENDSLVDTAPNDDYAAIDNDDDDDDENKAGLEDTIGGCTTEPAREVKANCSRR